MSAYRGTIRFTNRLLEELLGLPEGVHVTGLKNDPERLITEFYIDSADEVKGMTFFTGEGMAPPQVDADSHVKFIKDRESNSSVDEEKKIKRFKSWR